MPVAVTDPLRILVCDDERHIVRLVESTLRRQGHTVVGVLDGREAIARLRRETFDLLVLDAEMPDVSGEEVLRWVRANKATRSLRVVILDGESKRGGGGKFWDLFR